jgi:hypothetical protein
VGAEDEDDPTVIRFVPSTRDTRPEVREAPPAPPPLTASRVAVMSDPETGRPTLMVLPPGVAAPPGCAVAMLVASSSSDTLRLGELLEHFVLEQS